ncbi:RNA 2',3'-cyclic phosphodiesterase [Patescibacteria group bacterium]|nr:MAG: RNA 2',3'-cyclic phosphodiesterase [Patescibacteria group bacterium]
MPRIFIALPVPEEAKNELELAQNEIKRLNERVPIKWTERQNMHITLAFLGDITDGQAEQVKKVLDEAAKRPGFSIWLDSLDGFPDLNRPKVLVCAAAEEKRDCAKLHKDLEEKLFALGLEFEDHIWRPHITLGRVKREWNNPNGLAAMPIEKINWLADKIELIESELAPAGPVYNILQTFKLTP